MFSRIRKFLASPRFAGDEVRTRSANLLNIITLATFAGALVYAPFAAPARLIYVLVAMGINLTAWWALKRGFVKAGSFIIVIGMVLIIALSAYTGGGIRAPAYIGLIVVVLVAGLLLGGKAAAFVAAFSILYGAYLLLAGSRGLLPELVNYSDGALFMVFAVFFVMIGVIFIVALRILDESLARVRTELGERTQAEQELLQFRRIMDESNDAIFLIDPETSRYLDFNRMAHERLGYARDELRQLGVVDIAEHVASLKAWKRRVSIIQETGGLIFETAYQRKDGSKYPVEVSARLLSNGTGNVIVAVARDITERKHAEMALRESEERFRRVFHSSPIAICITTLHEGRLLDANYAYWDFSGYDPETSIGRDYVELEMWVPPEARLEFVRRIRQKHSIYNPEYQFTDSDGIQKSALAFYELVQLGGQECVLSMFYDMSAQKKTMQALQQSEMRIRALLNAFPDMILELSSEGTILSLLPPKGTATALPAEWLAGRRIQDILSGDSGGQALAAIQRTMDADEMSSFEFGLHTDSALRFMEARLVRSTPDTALMMIRDITARKETEREREHLIRELELRNQESETLRESLASIVGTFEFSEIIQRILGQIRRVIPFDTASVWRMEGNYQEIIAGVDLPPEVVIPGTRFVVDEVNSAFPLLSGEIPYILNNNVQEELPDFQYEPHTYVQSWLAIPLRTHGKVVGLIALDGRQRNQFTSHHADLAVTFANQLAVALENVVLFSDLQKELDERRRLIAELELKNAESETLRESTAIVAETLDKTEAIDRILEQLEKVVHFDSASVQLISGTMLEMVSARGFELSAEQAENRFELNEGEPAYPVIQGTVPYVLFDDIQEVVPAFREPPHNQIHGWLAVPLKVKGQMIGVIALDGHHIGQFSERDAALAVTYANQVAIALENARLFSDLQTELGLRKNLIIALENKNAELERFTYTVSHDLKSPLFTIRGFLGYLEQDAASGNQERLKADIERIAGATDKMQQLLNDLLELSRIGRLMNEPQEVPFEALAHEVVELLHGQIREHNVRVQVQPGMPAVHGDRQRLAEVIQNLVDNAAKFMGDQPDPLIEIGTDGDEGGMPVFYVRDNGVGLDAEHFERVFGLFNKLDPRSEGTGIGLSLVKRIIEFHGGRIWVQSKKGSGSTFYFTLPSAVTAPAQPPQDSVI